MWQNHIRYRLSKKGVYANVDFYSGLVYKLLNIPDELYTPLFAVARIAGWSAHLIEEFINGGKIIRPAFKNITKSRKWKDYENRVEFNECKSNYKTK